MLCTPRLALRRALRRAARPTTLGLVALLAAACSSPAPPDASDVPTSDQPTVPDVATDAPAEGGTDAAMDAAREAAADVTTDVATDVGTDVATDAPSDVAADVANPDGGSDPAARCTATGGTVAMSLCCMSASDFPNQCLTGACGCAPASSHMVRSCSCPASQCFDGTGCVPR